MRKTIALIGSSSTGKSTVFDLLRIKLPKYEFINESTRTVAKWGFPINENGTSETQLAISTYHLEALLKPGNLVLDRCYMDLVVYSYHMKGITPETAAYINSVWSRVQDEYSHFVYFPIEFEAVDDGVRSTNEEWRRKVDSSFKVLLDDLKRPYLTVTGSPMQRVNQILNFIN